MSNSRKHEQSRDIQTVEDEIRSSLQTLNEHKRKREDQWVVDMIRNNSQHSTAGGGDNSKQGFFRRWPFSVPQVTAWHELIPGILENLPRQRNDDRQGQAGCKRAR